MSKGTPRLLIIGGVQVPCMVFIFSYAFPDFCSRSGLFGGRGILLATQWATWNGCSSFFLGLEGALRCWPLAPSPAPRAPSPAPELGLLPLVPPKGPPPWPGASSLASAQESPHLPHQEQPESPGQGPCSLGDRWVWGGRLFLWPSDPGGKPQPLCVVLPPPQ